LSTLYPLFCFWHELIAYEKSSQLRRKAICTYHFLTLSDTGFPGFPMMQRELAAGGWIAGD
jgi:hypothetical protein